MEFEQKLVAILKADSDVISDLAQTSSSILPSWMGPIGRSFPQITYSYDPGESEEILPATRGTLTIEVWVEKTQSGAYSFLRTKQNQIDAVINRQALSLTSVDDDLRTVSIYRLGGGEPGYDKELEKHYITLEYAVVRSEGEHFSAAYAGNQPWQT